MGMYKRAMAYVRDREIGLCKIGSTDYYTGLDALTDEVAGWKWGFGSKQQLDKAKKQQLYNYIVAANRDGLNNKYGDIYPEKTVDLWGHRARIQRQADAGRMLMNFPAAKVKSALLNNEEQWKWKKYEAPTHTKALIHEWEQRHKGK